ncbi:MAG: Uma2 family endonuclease [Vicinamibacteria bacterium]
MATTSQWTATERDLLAAPQDGNKYELVDGQIRMSPAGARHGQVCVNLSVRLGSFVSERGLGFVFDSSTGFRLPNGNVRLPDLAYVARGRFEGDRVPEDFSPIPPDLAVEVLSPSDRPRAVLDKVGEHLGYGVRLIWVIDPAARRATIYRSLSDVTTIAEDGMLDGETILPGFRCRLGEIF